jgi:8-oxo-dGTP pyrophosphatase MutT (NUDIX family)
LYLQHLVDHPSGWSRECPGAHLTASSLICALDDRQVLLTLHARIGRWLQTGGHIEDDDESLERAAIREASEESGLTGLGRDQVDRLPDVDSSVLDLVHAAPQRLDLIRAGQAG